MTSATCKACGKPKRPGFYLCGACWFLLPAPTRRALNRRDRFAVRRLASLLDHIGRETPLPEIDIKGSDQ